MATFSRAFPGRLAQDRMAPLLPFGRICRLQAEDLRSLAGDSSMLAAEFQARVIAGKIEIPEDLRGQFHGEVNVILFAEGDRGEESGWPGHNRRRWELIAKTARQGLTADEAKELSTLQHRADEEQARVGLRPVEELERLCAELSKED
jgi:hypothetical protein